jgi:hypothetical protein
MTLDETTPKKVITMHFLIALMPFAVLASSAASLLLVEWEPTAG